MRINISPRQITKLLICIVLILTVIHCTLQFLEFGLGFDRISHVRTIFDFEYDNNLTTWYSSITLLLCSVLLAVIAIAKKRTSDRYSLHWQILAVIFAIMSLDEVAMLHERAGNLIDILSPVEYSGWLNYQWVLLGIPLTAIIAIAYLKFMLHLPARTRNLFFLAGALFVGGALGLEMLSGHQASLNNRSSQFLYTLYMTIEELWEKLGVLVFIHALLTYIEKYIPPVQISIGDNSSSKQANLSQLRDREYLSK